MKRLILTPSAQNDIDSIYDYTYDEWGLEKAEDYTNDLQFTCRDLASGRKKGRNASHIRAGFRSQLAKSHIVFYIESATDITIIRILHQSQNITEKLTQ